MIDVWTLLALTIYGIFVLFVLSLFAYVFAFQIYSAKMKYELDYLEKSNNHKLDYLQKFHKLQNENSKETK